MTRGMRRPVRPMVALAVVGALTILMAVAALMAASPAPAASPDPVQLAQAAPFAARRSFDIPAQPLTSALAAFGQQSGLQVTVDGALARGQSAPAVRGQMSAGEALDRLLAPSGLRYGMPGGTTVVIERAAAGSGGQLQLAPVQVQANAAAAGYQATTDSFVASHSPTGTKTTTPILDTPASISVITEKEMQTRAVQSLQQALTYTSSVSVDEFGSDDRYDFFRIRGFDQTSLGTYRDGLPMRIPGWTSNRVEPYGLEQIDVLKGSTSSLFGLNGPGGLVNAITKRPRDSAHGEVFGRLGTGQYATGVDFGGPTDASGAFSYRMTGLLQEGDNGADYSRDDRAYIAPAVTWRPRSGTSLTLLTDVSKRNSNSGYGFPAGSDIDPDTFLGEPDFNKFDTEQADVGYLLSHAFGPGLTFRQGARYTHLELDYEQVYGAMADPSVSRAAFSVDGTVDRFAIDNQLQHDRSWGLVDTRTLVGLDYAHDRNREIVQFGSAPGIDINNPAYCGRSCITLFPYLNWTPVQDSVGAYAQEELTIDRQWIVTLGGRYDYVDNQTDYEDRDVTEESTARAFTKRAGLTYKATENLALYGNYSESFQPLYAPGFNGYTIAGSLEPQEGTQYEVGIKYKPAGLDALFTLALFDLTQTNVPTQVSPIEQQQIGEVRTRGVEFEGKMSLDERTNMTLAYSFWDAEIIEDGIAGNEGNRPDRVPEHLASAWVDHTFPGRGESGDFTVGFGLRYVGDTWGDTANTVKVDGYAIADAALGYRVTDNVSLQLNVTNLFDKEYVSANYFGSVYYGDRRMVLATFKYTW